MYRYEWFATAKRLSTRIMRGARNVFEAGVVINTYPKRHTTRSGPIWFLILNRNLRIPPQEAPRASQLNAQR
jgi:hypothetical protein